jgi:DNA-binding SARP family transcriptional activator
MPPSLFDAVDPPADFEPISRAKVTPTPVRPETLHRGRLLDWLAGHAERRLSLVVADAGYGKTTLLADYAQRAETRCLWLKLEHTDGDWVTFINYLVAAYGEAVPGFGHLTLPLMAPTATIRASREMVVGTFMSELAKLTDEPMILILDDYHLVDEAADVQLIVGRLLRDAPPTMTYVLLTRRRPELPIGRLSASGEVGELGTNALRFSRDEIRQLFAESYGQPLEEDVLDEVDRRTLGWAACLQLLRPTLRGRSNIEVREFVKQLSGATGRLYDFLAEEVLREATPEMRRFLVTTSLLEHIVPGHVAALFAADDPPPTDDGLRSRIQEAYETGLIGRGDPAAGSFRFHPLLREFLSRQLVLSTSAEDIRDMHLRIAGAAEHDAWLTSCRHYLAAGREREAARVLVRSVLVAVGTGTWGAAAEVVSQLAGHSREPEIEVVVALEEIDAGRLDGALRRLKSIELRDLDPSSRALVRHGLLRANWMSGDLGASIALVDEIVSDTDTPPPFRNLAEGHRLVFSPRREQDLPNMAYELETLAEQHASAGFAFFAGVSFNNAMVVEYYRGRYERAAELGRSALESFRSIEHHPKETPTTCAVLATCSTELGRFAEADEYRAIVDAVGTRDVDALSEMAYLAAVTGAADRALSLLSAAADSAAVSLVDPASRTTWALARAVRATIESRPANALEILEGDQSHAAIGVAARISSESLAAIALFSAARKEEAAVMGQVALELAQRCGSEHWVARMRILVAAASEDRALFGPSVEAGARAGELALLELADVISGSLHLLASTPEAIYSSIGHWPGRWLRSLRAVVSLGLTPAGLAAARLLDEVGTLSDIPLLRAFDRTYFKGNRAQGLGIALVRAKSPLLAVHDLGRCHFDVGDRSVLVSSMRRRAAGLLFYLIARPNQTAAREQVLEDLWPDLSPTAAANSLNQTLFFLRREIDPYYDEGASFNYVAYEGEVVWLDQAKMAVDSVAFLRSATSALAMIHNDPSPAIAAVAAYTGRFAPEFEYEEWALDWRDHLHSTYLHLVQATQRRLAAARNLPGAIAVGRSSLAVDPKATDIERGLIWLYAAAGARAAASEQYAHFAAVYRDQFAAEPPSFADVVAGGIRDTPDD